MQINDIDGSSSADYNDEAKGKVLSGGRTLIGHPPNNHWVHNEEPQSFDLTRPAAPDFPNPKARESITLETTTAPITIAPSKTALVIVDMQNFFLSTALGRQADGPGQKAKEQLLEYALPAATLGGIQVIWLNWGLTTDDLQQMPAGILRAFGFKSATSGIEKETPLNELGKPRKLYNGLGNDIGPVKLEDGSTVDGGKLLMRDTWNVALPPDLAKTYQTGLQTSPPHIWIHKNRMSGLWGSTTPCTEFLEQRGIRTLLFTGVNTGKGVCSMKESFRLT